MVRKVCGYGETVYHYGAMSVGVWGNGVALWGYAIVGVRWMILGWIPSVLGVCFEDRRFSC